MLAQIHQGVMNSWHILKIFLKEEKIVRYYNGWNPLSSKPQIKKIKEDHTKEKEATKEEALSLLPASPNPMHFPKKGRSTRIRTGANHIHQVTGFQKYKNMPLTMSSTWPDP
ncbi:hypothetical protein O181_123995 [Austropuccinia psidii MF-1]|uniref:Uncharacterized protein n=1 Tax=Austropuccinia psidii MF-1 TaxID=1389203 RepID=A0A9Q3KM72_9BASI|nr:hypothetical protein [Austropuccinia psidii MF-1]